MRDPPVTGQIAFIGTGRQVHVIRPDGSSRRAVTYPRQLDALSRWGGAAANDACSWPCWSPDGSWLACFRAHRGRTGSETVNIVEVDGVEERQLLRIPAGAPVYAQWSPSGDALAVVLQTQQHLELWICDPDRVGEQRLIDHGAPLFFTWTPDSRHLLIHAGNREGRPGRLLLRDRAAGTPPALFATPPGSFCTPLIVGGQAIYVSREGTDSVLFAAQPDGSTPAELTRLEGLLAIVASPDQDRVAVAASDAGERTPYQGIWLVDLVDGHTVRATDESCLAFFWSPTGEELVYVGWDDRQTCLWWRIIDLKSGQTRSLCPFWPSRDQLFSLQFFEQFVLSHPAISPDGRALVFSGHDNPDLADSRRSPPQVHVLRLDTPDSIPRAVATGNFCAFSHSGS